MNQSDKLKYMRDYHAARHVPKIFYKNCVVCGKAFEAKGKGGHAQKTDTAACSKKLKQNTNRARWENPQYREKERNRVLSLSESERQRRRDAQKQWRIKNRERVAFLARRWVDKNKDRKRALATKYWHEKIKLDPNKTEYHRIHSLNRSRKVAPLSKRVQHFFLSMKLGEAVKQQDIMKNPIKKTTPSVKQFIDAFISRLKGIEDSCVELAAMVDANPNVFEEIIIADSRFSYNMLESMRKVGKGELYCELLFDPSLAARKLLPLPVAQQKELYNKPCKIVRNIGGKNTVEEKPLQKLSRHELTLLIDDEKGRARTVEEQIAFVAPPTPARRAERYEIKENGNVIVLAQSEFTASQLQEIADRAKEKALKSLATKK